MKLDSNENIKKILNKWDFLGVMPCDGGPKDEYDWLAVKITEKLKEDLSIDDLENYLENYIIHYFGLSLNVSLKENIKKYSAKIIMQKVIGD